MIQSHNGTGWAACAKACTATRHKVTVERRSHDGQRQRVCRSTETHDEALDLERQLRARPAAADRQTVSDAVERYLSLHGPRFAPNTRLGYAQQARRVRSSWLGETLCDRLDEEMLTAYYSQLLSGTDAPGARALSTRSVKLIRALVRAALNDVARPSLRWVRREQYEGARVLGAKPRERAHETLELADVARVIAAGDLEVREIAQLAIATGARQGELAALRWRDVDLVTGVVKIAESVSRCPLKGTRGETQLVRKSTKTGRPRHVRVDASCVAMLTDRYSRQLLQAARAGVDADDDLGDRAVLSTLLERDHVDPRSLGQRWRRARKASKVTADVRFHDLRHVSATAMLAGGVNPVAAAARGWGSTQTMLGSYAHVLGGVDDGASTVLEGTWRTIAAGA
ncbi:MAG TPA: tyrosine-type recombinase/integrase [Caldimonas sp.]|nr:tyrosine-type recombinase/integrase [Caldimonas sp.]